MHPTVRAGRLVSIAGLPSDSSAARSSLLRKLLAPNTSVAVIRAPAWCSSRILVLEQLLAWDAYVITVAESIQSK
jgi:hypothetical protein